MLTRSQEKTVEIILLFKKIWKSADKELDEWADITDISELESERSAVQEKQPAKGLKILTPDQMPSKLLITLAQLKVGNNSEKLENEIGHLLYSLYGSKELIKTIYNNLINVI